MTTGGGLFTAEELGGIDYQAQGKSSERERDRVRKAQSRRGARDVFVPPVADPERREACRQDLERFCLTYFGPLFYLAFCLVHRRIIKTLEESILHGGRVALAAPRGFGKTTLTRIAILWAICYGHAKYMVIVCATGDESAERLEEIKSYFEDPDHEDLNPAFHEDFPEICAPVVALDNSPQRAGKQTVNGKYTRLKWGAKRVIFPRVDGSEAAGSIVTTRSLEGAIRGLVRGKLRPDLLMLDDPQTEESARSEYQTTERKKILSKAIEGLVGPGHSLTIMGLWTIMEHNDLAHQYTSGKVPGYRALHEKTVETWPEDMNLTHEYIAIRQAALRAGDYEARAAHAWYIHNLARIEKGLTVSWGENFNPDPVSDSAMEAIDTTDPATAEARAAVDRVQLQQKEVSNYQRCLNLIAALGDEGWDSFRAEYQNEPPEPETAQVVNIVSQNVVDAVSGYPRGLVPEDSVAIVEGRDVGRYRINWAVCAVMPNRRLFVIDYGEEPVDSPRGKVEKNDSGKVLQRAIEQAIKGALLSLDESRHNHPYTTPDGEIKDVDMCLVDSRYGTPTVRDYADNGGPTVQAVMGMGTGKGQRKWFVPQNVHLSRDGNLYARRERGALRFYSHADAYKRQVHAGFLLDYASPGCLRIYEPEHRREHLVFAQHMTAEEEVEIADGVSKWQKVKGRSDNHYFDAVCYCQTAVSYIEHWLEAVRLDGAPDTPEEAPEEEKPAEELKPKKRIRKAKVCDF